MPSPNKVTALPRHYNPNGLGNVTPRYSWHVNPAKFKITGEEVMEPLADAKPAAIGALEASISPAGRMPDEPEVGGGPFPTPSRQQGEQAPACNL